MDEEEVATGKVTTYLINPIHHLCGLSLMCVYKLVGVVLWLCSDHETNLIVHS